MSQPIRVVPYTDEWVDAVRAFNKRVAASGQELPETPRPGWMPCMELFLAVEDEVVRGGYILRHQRYWVKGQETEAAHYRLPLSEGTVNRRYAALGLHLVRDALKREPRLYCSGMSGWDKPLPLMLRRLGWRMCEVPFHFKVLRPYRFLRNIRALRSSRLRRAALDLAAFSGMGWFGIRGARVNPVEHDRPASFRSWPDAAWEAARTSAAFLAARDSATLEALYPASDPRFLRVRTIGGWAVVLDTRMRNDRYFGDMYVGTIVDCLAAPGEAAEVIRAATGELEARGIDLIISNQLHREWRTALDHSGFRTGPSNYLLALSPEFAALAGDAPDHEFHFNRGDGDGPIHL
ncbi:MAG TPA: hypothetical protein VMH28_32630 [Candidatus Acidoferrales bacterium]|nr:hypothetical protein [Candidatus Acidoferrales bacterium]